MNARTKQHKAWDRELKREWHARGQNGCELCGDTFGQALAHSRKRRFIDTKELYWEVALLCHTCHERIEHSGHEAMEAEIKRIIESRGNA